MPTVRIKPDTSEDIDSLASELRYAGDREIIARTCSEIGDHLRSLALPETYWEFIEVGRGKKKNFAQRLSVALAQKTADALRPRYSGIFPNELGVGHERKARSAEGLKKLDVIYSTLQGGLRLSISIKTINFKDEKTKRYTKNIKRADGELRAEASDCHRYNPYAVLAAMVLFPSDAAEDGPDSRSSLKHGWDVYRRRAGRGAPTGDPSLFELVFIGTYDTSPNTFGNTSFFETTTEPPDRGMPTTTLSFSEVLARINRAYDERDR
jgi:hypothetical protein